MSKPLRLLKLILAAAISCHCGIAHDMTLRPEHTDWRETSTSAEVVALLEQAAAMNPQLHLTRFGESAQGRPLPLLVVGPDAATPEAVRASGKLRIYLKGNIHAGEVAGKEALLQLVRDLARGEHTEWTHDLVLLIGPNYNSDGNESLDPRNRIGQHGPIAGMGTRENAQKLDLNRDMMKLDAPESRAFVQLLNDWDPHVIVDLHTTNGTYHAYHLTYAPGLHPATPQPLDTFLRDELLPSVTREIEARWGWHFWHYGNVAERDGRRGWWTFDARPRYVTNYIGVRGRLAILSEAYSYLTFEDRTRATKRFLIALLDYLHAHRDATKRLVEAQTASDRTALPGTRFPLRGVFPTDPPEHEVLMGGVIEGKHPQTGEPLLLRRDEVRPERMPAATGFVGADWIEVPEAYLLSADAGELVAQLRRHGIVVENLPADWQGRAQAFRITSTQKAERLFQGRHERSLTGEWEKAQETNAPAGGFRVSLRQPLARLAVLLLEPTADDGLVDWGFLDPWIEHGRPLPVWREPVQP